MPDGLHIEPVQGTNTLRISHDSFPGGYLDLRVPESIGDAASGIWPINPQYPFKPEWKPIEGGYHYEWIYEEELSYAVEASVNRNSVDVKLTLKNLSKRYWDESYAYCCLDTRMMPEFLDMDGYRTQVFNNGKFMPITKLIRKDSPRPTMQFWYLKESASPVAFVEQFNAAPDNVTPEGIIFVHSWTGRNILAAASDKPLFLFSDLQYPCIYSCPGFGALAPGEESVAMNKIMVLTDTKLDDFGPILQSELPNYKLEAVDVQLI